MPSSPHAPIIVRDRDHLEELIKEVFEKDGPNCDLNFIDASKITDMGNSPLCNKTTTTIH